MDTSDICSIDFETGSRADLKKTGAARYAEDPSTRILCLAYMLPGKQVKVWREGQPFPTDLIDWVRGGGKVSGWNVLFEFYIWNVVLRRQVANQPIPKLRVKQLHDTMAIAAYNGLPLGLDMAAQALPHLGIQKDKVGHALMLRMSRPRKKGTGGNPDVWWHETDPQRFDDLCKYCAQDVRVEHAILQCLIPLPSRERTIWELDCSVSIRGMLLDGLLADCIETIASRETLLMDTQMHRLTGGAVPTTRAVGQLLKYAQSIEPKIKSLAKDQLATWIGKVKSARLKEVLELRQQAAKSSVAKVNAMKSVANMADGRMRGLYQYYGAFRTGRDAGRQVQAQNFPRGSVKDQEALVNAILKLADAEFFEIFFGVPVLEALSSALRACITVPDGKWFCSYDFAQIEARVTPWLAGDERMLDVFRQGRDVYVVAASGIYGVPEGAVTGDQRDVGKTAVLALGFGGGVGAFQNMARIYGVEVDDTEADQIKQDWRDANPKVVRTWYALGDAAVRCLKGEGPQRVGYLRFRVEETDWGTTNLHMELPAGRDLIYRDAELGTDKFGRDIVTAMGVDQYTRKWVRTDMWGGLFFQNAVQAVARDCMKSAALRVNRLPGADLIGPVHDELLMELDDPVLEGQVARVMKAVPPWAPGLPIDADGYVGKRFRK